MFPLTDAVEEISIDGFHNIYYFEFGKFHYHSPEKHDFWEMVYVDKGKILANTDGNICTLEEGQAIFHSPGQIHAHISNKEVANNLLVVSFSCKSSIMDFFNGKVFTLDKTGKTLLSLFVIEAKNALGHVSNDFYNSDALDFSNERFGASQLLKMHFTELLIKLVRGNAHTFPNISFNEGLRDETSNKLVSSITLFLKENVYSDITLEDICNKYFVRKSRLCNVFKEYTGTSPMSYFKGLITEEAKKLLREQSMSVSEICDKLGYSSIHNFTRSFKTVTGFSPTGYRKSILLLQSTSEKNS